MSSGFPPSPFISSRIVCRIVDAAAARGADPVALCRAAGIEPEHVRDIDGQVEFGRYLKLWAEAGTRIPDPGFAISVASTWEQTHNLLRFLCMSSANLGDALERASRYLRVITNAVSWPLERRDGVMVVAMDRDALGGAGGGGGPEARCAEEFGAAEIVTLARGFTGVDLSPVELRFTFEEPSDTRAHRAFFRAPLLFGRPRAEIHLPMSSLRLPLLKADASTLTFFEAYVSKLIQSDGTPGRLSDQVNRVLVEGLRGRAPTLEEVAIALSVSGRTLRRRLHGEGSTFQGLLDEARSALAKRHIEQAKVSIAEVSFLLGFSEPSAFHRAFRRWTGMTPQAYARARAEPSLG